MSVTDLLKQNFIDGGPFFMTLHCMMWILVIYYSIRFVSNYRSINRDYKKLEKYNATILFIGGFGLLFSLFYRTVGIYSAFSVLEVTNDISPTLFARGFKASLIAPIYSLFLFLITSIIWFINRNRITSDKLA
jgi:hypothetical protein